jgi:CBS domain-containing protein
MPHAGLSAPLTLALGTQAPAPAATYVRATDSLHVVMAALSTRNMERLAVANDAGQLVGAVSVLDVLKFFATDQHAL